MTGPPQTQTEFAREGGLRLQFTESLANKFIGKLSDCFYVASLWFSQRLRRQVVLVGPVAGNSPPPAGEKVQIDPEPKRSKVMPTAQQQFAPASKVPVIHATINLVYRGETAMQIRGVVTGQVYQFSPLCPVQPIDRRDAAFITQTRLLHPLPRPRSRL